MSKFQKIIKNSEQNFLLTFTFFAHKNQQNSLWNSKLWKDKLFPCRMIFFKKLKKAFGVSKRNFDAMCALCE